MSELILNEHFAHDEPKDRTLLGKLCERHGLDLGKMQKVVSKIEHACGQLEFNGVFRDVVFARTIGSESIHRISMGDDGVFYCSCPAWLHKGGRDKMKPCKHLLYTLVCGLATAECRLQYYV